MRDEVREAALRLLEYRDRSVSELRQRLARKSYPEEEIEEVIADLEECGLLDDRRFAELLAQSAVSSGKGRRFIAHKLKEKDVDSLVAQQVLEQIFEEEDERVLCLKKALSVCGLSGYFEVDRDGGLMRLEETGGFLPELPEPLGYFEPKDEATAANRRKRRDYCEKAKARLTRRLVSAGFSPGMAYEAIRKIERL